MATNKIFSIGETSRRSKKIFRKFYDELLGTLNRFYMISIDINWQLETQIGFDGEMGIKEDVPTGRKWVTFSIELYDKKEWKKRYE